MSEGFSFNREFDFVRLAGLRRATGRPAHEWDLYVIKELIDNALDADEELLGGADARVLPIGIRIEYIEVPERKAVQVFVQVSNNSLFPAHKIGDIFSTRRYASRKAFMKGLSRGALGNALKTLLGIPYALRNRVAGDWNPELNPLSITCGGREYLPRYVVDSTKQELRFECETKEGRSADGTVVSVGLDQFSQDSTRTVAEIRQLAESYHLCNPHFTFRWDVERFNEEWEQEYAGDPAWGGKYRGLAPVTWYPPTAFQDLLGALYRERHGDKADGRLPIVDVCRQFAGFTDEAKVMVDGQERPLLTAIPELMKQSELSREEVKGPAAVLLYQTLSWHSPKFKSGRLGGIGEQHVRTVFDGFLQPRGSVVYETSSDPGDDPTTPFNIEIALAQLKGGGRQLWTAVNYTPTYLDPFMNYALTAQVAPDKQVIGLRGLLDAYGIREDEPVVLFVHLVCPTVEHQEFSKSQINPLPFRDTLSQLLDRALANFKRMREEEELRLEQIVFNSLDEILGELERGERLVVNQLLEKVLARTSSEPALARWLELPTSRDRLRTYIGNYQSRNVALKGRVASESAGELSVPAHPEGQFTVFVEQVSGDMFARHHVNKLLYVQDREMEPMFIYNDWLSRLDMALLLNPASPERLRDLIEQCVRRTELDILVLHDADEEGRALVPLLKSWLAERQLAPERVVDLGLDGQPGASPPQAKLIQIMPRELFSWLTGRFRSLGISGKFIPPTARLRDDIRGYFQQLLHAFLWNELSAHFEIAGLISALDKRLNFNKLITDPALGQQIKRQLELKMSPQAYTVVRNRVVGDLFNDLMREHGRDIQAIIHEHLAQVQNKTRWGR